MLEREVEVEGVRARFREAGSGQPLVLVHGLGLSSRIYEHTIAALAAAGHHVYAPDLPGFGATPGPATGLSVPASAAWLVSFARAQQLDRCVWVGHSHSCQTILHIAAERAPLARALVLIAPTGAPERARAPRQLLRFARNALREPPRVVLDVLRDYAHTAPLRFLGTWVRSFADAPLSVAQRVSSPALVLLGTRDPVIPRWYADALCARLRSGTFRAVAEGAHGTPFDRRGALNAAIIEWLATLGA